MLQMKPLCEELTCCTNIIFRKVDIVLNDAFDFESDERYGACVFVCRVLTISAHVSELVFQQLQKNKTMKRE